MHPTPERTSRLMRILITALALLTNLSSTSLAVAEPIRHSFLIAGPSFTGIIDEEGKETWDSGKPAARDGFVLPSGNVLIAWSDEVKELTRDKKVVFHFLKSPDNREIGTVERLENGRTLIT